MNRPTTADASPQARSLAPTGVDVAIWVAAVVAIAGTLWLSLAPHVGQVLPSDKLGHGLAYAVDTLLLLLAVVWRPGRPQALVAWTLPIVLGVATLGATIEFVQATVGRDGSALDWIADLVGIAVATIAFALLRRRFGASEA